MGSETSLYWFVRCDRCGKAVTAHAMSLEREAMLCMGCLRVEDTARHAAPAGFRDPERSAAPKADPGRRLGGAGGQEVAA